MAHIEFLVPEFHQFLLRKNDGAAGALGESFEHSGLQIQSVRQRISALSTANQPSACSAQSRQPAARSANSA